jgi:hypothetical protein
MSSLKSDEKEGAFSTTRGSARPTAITLCYMAARIARRRREYSSSSSKPSSCRLLSCTRRSATGRAADSGRRCCCRHSCCCSCCRCSCCRCSCCCCCDGASVCARVDIVPSRASEGGEGGGDRVGGRWERLWPCGESCGEMGGGMEGVAAESPSLRSIIAIRSSCWRVVYSRRSAMQSVHRPMSAKPRMGRIRCGNCADRARAEGRSGELVSAGE